MPKSKSKQPKKSKKQEKKIEILVKEEKQTPKEENLRLEKRREIKPEFSDDFEELLLEEDFTPSSPSLRKINSSAPVIKLEEQAKEVFLDKDKKQSKDIYSSRTTSIYDSKTPDETKNYDIASQQDPGRRLDTEQDSNLLSRHGMSTTPGIQQWGSNNQNDNKDREYVSEGKRLESNSNGLPFQKTKRDYILR